MNLADNHACFEFRQSLGRWIKKRKGFTLKNVAGGDKLISFLQGCKLGTDNEKDSHRAKPQGALLPVEV